MRCVAMGLAIFDDRQVSDALLVARLCGEYALAVDIVGDLRHAQARAVSNTERSFVLDAWCRFAPPNSFLMEHEADARSKF